MNELSLFTGMGGGIYGSLILGWKTIAYVERDAYCQQVIKQRQLDGWFDKGEIYGDIADFNKDNASQYSGKVDVLTGGFPCQPFSVAGKGKGTSDERWLFDEIIKSIQIIRPQFLFFENVPGILKHGAIIQIYRTLDDIRYRVKKPLVLGSRDCVSIQKRNRVWIYATDTESLSIDATKSKTAKHSEQPQSEFGNSNCQFSVADNHGERCGTGCNSNWRGTHGDGQEWQYSQGSEKRPQLFDRIDADADVQPSDGNSQRSERVIKEALPWQQSIQGCESIRGFEDLLERPDIPEPLFRGMDDELPNWKQRLTAIGNGQDPIVMATAWKLLYEM